MGVRLLEYLLLFPTSNVGPSLVSLAPDPSGCALRGGLKAGFKFFKSFAIQIVV